MKGVRGRAFLFVGNVREGERRGVGFVGGGGMGLGGEIVQRRQDEYWWSRCIML